MVNQKCRIIILQFLSISCRKGRYEVDGYVYNKDEEPKIMITGKWNTSLSYQPCDVEGEPIEGTELTEVSDLFLCISSSVLNRIFHLVYVRPFQNPTGQWLLDSSFL